MSMTKEEFINILRDAASEEFAEFSPNESDYTYRFSERFERRMDRLVRAESRSTWRLIHTKPKRLILIATAVAVAMLLVACTVPEIRESVAGFFIRMFSDHSEITSSETIRQSIEQRYELVPVPEGFSVLERRIYKNVYEIDYIDKRGNCLSFRQIADSAHYGIIDIDYGGYNEYITNEKDVFIYDLDYGTWCCWVEDGYVFYLTYSSSVNWKILESWICSVTPVR